MPLLSLGARRIIDRAVGILPEGHIWRAWATDHPRVRLPGDPWDYSIDLMPDDVVRVVAAGLNGLIVDMNKRLQKPELSDDDAAEIDNDLAYVESILNFIVGATSSTD